MFCLSANEQRKRDAVTASKGEGNAHFDLQGVFSVLVPACIEGCSSREAGISMCSPQLLYFGSRFLGPSFLYIRPVRYVIAVVDNVENLEHAFVRHFVWSDDAAMLLGGPSSDSKDLALRLSQTVPWPGRHFFTAGVPK